ncbi:pentapeptide repeat-containing protein [Rothia mucilaginosa]|uniref:pentapeptide repeat-containing protein n=1 Tax=Rothia mucilaginosa TaxID=43675 RepID=UPI0028ECBD1C|nr:pentapeptide repeat-containing protein [Rothia mucilaginosa]
MIKKIEQITADYAKFHEEQDVRRTIFVEMSKRSSTFTKNRKGKVVKTASGTWSEFDFDFSRAPIFYPLDFLTIEKGKFRSAKFHSSASCVETTFAQNAHFMQTTFAQNAYFTGAIFAQDVYFAWATFAQDAYFAGATFAQYTNFMGATFTNNVDFSNSIFETDEPTFARENYRARFGVQDGQEDYKFSVRSGSKPIQLGKAELDEVKRRIPVGAVLVDPDSGRTSDPAK